VSAAGGSTRRSPRLTAFPRRRWWPVAAFLALTGLAAVIPWWLGPSNQDVYVSMGLATMVTLGLTLLMGFAGQISLGQAAFYMVGAYVAGILSAHGVPTVAALVIAPLATALLAAVVGIPLLRLRGNYLAFATLALQLIFTAVILNQTGLTGGEIGLTTIPPLRIGGQITGAGFATLVWVLTMLSVLLARNLVASRPGRGLQAIAAGEVSAAAVGVPVAAYKLRLFVLSAGLAALAGALYAFDQQFLSPDAFPIVLSVEFLVMAAVGGMGSVPGALVGAVVITLLQNRLDALGTVSWLPSTAPQIASLGVYGALLILVLLFFPRGLLPSAVSAIRTRLGRGTRRGQLEPEAATAPDATVESPSRG
jgi:branched-chain amino acid transport system permease protein